MSLPLRPGTGAAQGATECVPAPVPASASVPVPQKVSPAAVALIKVAGLETLLQSNNASVTSITLGPDFDVRDEHIQQLVNALGPQLRTLRMGSSDTGNGVSVTDAGVMSIVGKCRQLEVLQLSSCTGVSDSAFTAVLEQLVELRELHCTGHDRTQGKLTRKALDPLINGAAPKLRHLYLTDQGVPYEAVSKLIKARGKSGLQVQAGETDSDSFAWGCVMQQMGRSYGDGLYGNVGGGAGGGAKRGGRGGGGAKRGNKRAKQG